MAAELRATASTSETTIVADAGSIPGLLVEPKELASVADIVDPGRVMNVGAYGATKMVRGSLMSTPVATGTKDGPYDLMAIIAKKWHGQGSGYRVANSFENMPVGQSNILRVTLDALAGDSNTPKDVVFLSVAILYRARVCARL